MRFSLSADCAVFFVARVIGVLVLVVAMGACTKTQTQNEEAVRESSAEEPKVEVEEQSGAAAEHAASVSALMLLKMASALDGDESGHTGEAKVRWDSYQERDRKVGELVKLGRIDEASAILLELWKEGSDPAAPKGSPFAYAVAERVGTLVRMHPSARGVFVSHLEEMQREIQRCDVSVRLLSDFAHLARSAQAPEELIAHLDAIADSECMVKRWKQAGRRSSSIAWYLRQSGREDLAEMITR